MIVAGNIFLAAGKDADDISNLYNCKKCTGDIKKDRGCMRPKRRAVASFECVECSGKKSCICGGKERFEIKQCPVAYTDPRAFILCNFFLEYTSSNLFPNGKASMYQGIKLTRAFSVLAKIKYEIDKKESEKCRQT